MHFSFIAPAFEGLHCNSSQSDISTWIAAAAWLETVGGTQASAPTAFTSRQPPSSTMSARTAQPAAAAAANPTPTPGPAAAAAATGFVVQWEDIWEYCRVHRQPNVRNNDALKYFRWAYEDPVGVPSNPGVAFDLSIDEHQIYIPHHADKGTAFWFDQDCEQQPWSWRHLLGSLTKAPKELYASAVVELRIVPIPETCDHHRLANHPGAFPKGVRPPVWDFVVKLQDGTQWRLHPRHQRGKVDISRWDGGAFHSPIPKKGPGLSDGPGTYRRITGAHYGPDVAAYKHEPGLDPKADHYRSLRLQQQKASRASAAAGQGAASSRSAAPPAGPQPSPPAAVVQQPQQPQQKRPVGQKKAPPPAHLLAMPIPAGYHSIACPVLGCVWEAEQDPSAPAPAVGQQAGGDGQQSLAPAKPSPMPQQQAPPAAAPAVGHQPGGNGQQSLAPGKPSPMPQQQAPPAAAAAVGQQAGGNGAPQAQQSGGAATWGGWDWGSWNWGAQWGDSQWEDSAAQTPQQGAGAAAQQPHQWGGARTQ